MKVLLIQPPSNIMYSRRESKPCMPPLGLAYIAGYLRSKGHEVQILDMIAEDYYEERYFYYDENKIHYTDQRCIVDDFQFPLIDTFVEYGMSTDDLLRYIDKYEPDIIGVSCICSLRHFQACNIINAVKAYYPRIITVMGGNHPSSLPDLIMQDCNGNLDYLVIGEGEYVMEDIIEDKLPKGIVDLKYHTNIDDLPLPAHDLLPLDKYLEIWNKTQYHFYPAKKYVIMNTSRGCVNGCEHCPHEVVFGHGWRRRSLSKIEEEIQFVKSLGVEEIQFHEYNGFVDKKYMEDIAHLLKKYNMVWNVPIGVWLKPLTEEYIKMLKECGMNCIDLAIESPDSSILTTMPGKDVDPKHAEDVVNWCKKYGLYINAFFMIGFENQSLIDMMNTVLYAAKIGLDTCVFFIAQPLPKTILWNKAKFINNFHPFMLRYGKCNTRSNLWKAKDVEEIRYIGRKLFLSTKIGQKLRNNNCIEGVN